MPEAVQPTKAYIRRVENWNLQKEKNAKNEEKFQIGEFFFSIRISEFFDIGTTL